MLISSFRALLTDLGLVLALSGVFFNMLFGGSDIRTYYFFGVTGLAEVLVRGDFLKRVYIEGFVDFNSFGYCF
jgi:hypothetical protein